MTDFIQKFFLRNSKGLQFIVNEKLAKRKGICHTIIRNN